MKLSLALILPIAGPALTQAAQYANDEACDPNLTSPVAFGCTSTSDQIAVGYPTLGEIECGASLTISQSASIPFVKARTADPDKLYTLLLVDTTASPPPGSGPPGAPPITSPHPILHFGAVNIPGADLIGGLDLSTSDLETFSEYRGPNPPPPSFVPAAEFQKFNYEYMLAAQEVRVDTPGLTGNSNFDYAAFLASNTVGDVVSKYFSSGYCVESTVGPACKTVTTSPDFDLAQYISQKWYSHQQRPQPFQPATLLYCVSAEYDYLEKSDPRAMAGYDISVYNVAQDAQGNVYTSDDEDQLGPTAAGPLCGAQFAFDEEGPAKLTVGQCFLPPTTFGSSNYWVLGYDEEDGMALIGSQPDAPTSDGLCTFSSPFSGLWIFSRSSVRDETLIQKYRNIAIEQGIDPSIMLDVNQEDCDHDGDGDNGSGGGSGPEEIPGYVQIQGKSSDTGKKACWELRNGKIKEGNKIILGRCTGEDKNLFKVVTQLGANGETYLQASPKLAKHMMVSGVREASEKGWVRLEKPTGGKSGGGRDTTQLFYLLGNGMVGLAGDCYGSSCLFVTNQGTNTNYGDPVMLSTSSRLKKYAKQGDVIMEWTIVEED